MMASTSSSISAKLACRERPDAHLIKDYHAGDMICSKCGVVSDRVVDTGQEWRTSQNEKASSDSSRVDVSENPLPKGNNKSILPPDKKHMVDNEKQFKLSPEMAFFIREHSKTKAVIQRISKRLLDLEAKINSILKSCPEQSHSHIISDDSGGEYSSPSGEQDELVSLLDEIAKCSDRMKNQSIYQSLSKSNVSNSQDISAYNLLCEPNSEKFIENVLHGDTFMDSSRGSRHSLRSDYFERTDRACAISNPTEWKRDRIHPTRFNSTVSSSKTPLRVLPLPVRTMENFLDHKDYKRVDLRHSRDIQEW